MSTPSLRPHTKWGVAVALGVVGSLLVGLVVLAFLWPSKTSEARNLPVSITGPAATVTALEEALDKAAPGTFDFVEASDRDAAVAQIQKRETYGAIVLAAPPAMPEVLTAPAGSAVATQMLTGVAAQLKAQLVQQVTTAGGDGSKVEVAVTPIVPLADSDPTGSGLASASFPLMFGGMLGGVLVALLVVGAARRLAALAGFAVAAGLVLTVILQTWFEFLPGDFGVNALAMGVSILATSSFVVGCASLLGRAGLGLGAVVTMFFANPISAAAVPWQFLAEPWGAIGQWFVPGATNTLIRSVAYFPDADASRQWWILTGWIVLGAVLTLIGHFRARATMRVPQALLAHEAEAPAEVVAEGH
ncbi:MAG: hypothetical protein JST33_14965 [Actinobacteria bacterium]|nr:hypothetical protein [Actinomycetota bacterium]